jgi:NADPH:quinone reductase-like Zn-dependent oxidoreductase
MVFRSAFNFGIPAFPWINGRDLAGTVVQVSEGCKRVQVGDVVLVPSTDYRDIRKAAFQEYAVTTHFNAVRIPSSISVQDGASLGVAFVSATLALGISFGLDFSLAMHAGPNLLALVRQISQDFLPDDIRDECLSFSQSSNSELGSLKPGDWLAIWGGRYHLPANMTISISCSVEC